MQHSRGIFKQYCRSKLKQLTWCAICIQSRETRVWFQRDDPRLVSKLRIGWRQRRYTIVTMLMDSELGYYNIQVHCGSTIVIDNEYIKGHTKSHNQTNCVKYVNWSSWGIFIPFSLLVQILLLNHERRKLLFLREPIMLKLFKQNPPNGPHNQGRITHWAKVDFETIHNDHEYSTSSKLVNTSELSTDPGCRARCHFLFNS